MAACSAVIVRLTGAAGAHGLPETEEDDDEPNDMADAIPESGVADTTCE